MFAGFAKRSEGDCARSHSRIFLHTRDGGTYELSVVAADVVGASAEIRCPSFDGSEAIAEWVAKSDIVCAEYDGSSRVSAFATCSYQTANSRTEVYAVAINERHVHPLMLALELAYGHAQRYWRYNSSKRICIAF